MRKIGNVYIVPESEMETINWFLKLLDRHREQDKTRQEDQDHETDSQLDLQGRGPYRFVAGPTPVSANRS